MSSCFLFLLAYGIGCFRDTGRRAITTLEGRSFLLTGSYRSRRYAIEKCAQAAVKRGFRLFALQHGGWCAASRSGHRTYARYGKSNKCRNGKGGPWANNVYVLRGKLLHENDWFVFAILRWNDCHFVPIRAERRRSHLKRALINPFVSWKNAP